MVRLFFVVSKVICRKRIPSIAARLSTTAEGEDRAPPRAQLLDKLRARQAPRSPNRGNGGTSAGFLLSLNGEPGGGSAVTGGNAPRFALSRSTFVAPPDPPNLLLAGEESDLRKSIRWGFGRDYAPGHEHHSRFPHPRPARLSRSDWASGSHSGWRTSPTSSATARCWGGECMGRHT